MATAIRYDTTAWASFTVLEAKRILAFLGLSAGGGLEALERALPLRLYGFVNTQEVIVRAWRPRAGDDPRGQLPSVAPNGSENPSRSRSPGWSGSMRTRWCCG